MSQSQLPRPSVPLVFATALYLSTIAGVVGADVVTVQGVGQQSCEVWSDERQTALATGTLAWYHEQWVLGYITAFNRWVHDDSDVAVNLSDDKLFAWLDQYCAENPQQILSVAAEALISELRNRQP